jgi:hypothetical protein
MVVRACVDVIPLPVAGLRPVESSDSHQGLQEPSGSHHPSEASQECREMCPTVH